MVERSDAKSLRSKEISVSALRLILHEAIEDLNSHDSINFTKIWRHCIESESHQTLEKAKDYWKEVEKKDYILNELNTNVVAKYITLHKQDALNIFAPVFKMA